MLYSHITELIGNTPTLLLDPAKHGLKNIEVYAKLEYFNPFGSLKDRIAWGMIKDDIHEIRDGNKTIIEASSGNTMKALQVLASIHGTSVEAYTNRVKVDEVRQILQLLQVDLHEMPGMSECPDPTAPEDVFSIIEAKIASAPDRYFYPSQYTNQKNIDTHYQSTGKEIYNDVGTVDYLFGGLGTTGSTRGTATFLKEKNPDLKTIGIVAGRDDFIPGIRSINEMWDVGLFDKDFYETIITIESQDAVTATLELINHYGILAGPTSGAAYAATLAYLHKIDTQTQAKLKAVFIVCDRMEWYLSYFQKRRPELFGGTVEDTMAGLTKLSIDTAPTVKVSKLQSIIDAPNSILIDIRGSAAYQTGHIAGSINLRDDLLEQVLAKNRPFPKDTTIVCVCPIGEQSKKFAALLKEKGYTAASLEGGITAWRDAGCSLESSRAWN
jgi:cysteine synthase/rhodanese-related sulfurtransferase